MPKQRGSESGQEADERKWNGRPRESRKRKRKTEVNRKEAAAEIETGGRRKEIADEAIRRAVGGDRKVETTA